MVCIGPKSIRDSRPPVPPPTSPNTCSVLVRMVGGSWRRDGTLKVRSPPVDDTGI